MRKTALKLIAALIGIILVVVIILFVAQRGLIPGLSLSNYQLSVTVIRDRIQRLSALTTTRYSYSSIVTTEKDLPDFLKALYGEKLVMVAVGHVTAGIDMSQITQEDVTFEDSKLSLSLPAPLLQDCFLDDQASYVVSRDTGLFSRAAQNIDQESRRYAIQQFRDQALSEGILTTAQDQGKIAIEEFIKLLAVDSIKQLEIKLSDIDPNTVLPETCA